MIFYLHWLDVPERITFKLCMTVYKCLHGMGPIYLPEMCRPSSSEAGRRHLRSANLGQLVVPHYRLTAAGRRAFSCAGLSAWNSLSEYLTVDSLTLDSFKHSLKCFLFAPYWHSAWSALGILFNDSALYKSSLNNNLVNELKLHCKQVNLQNFHVWNSHHQHVTQLFQTTLCVRLFLGSSWATCYYQ